MSRPEAGYGAAPIAYDMIRLFLGPMATRPRGIDRVDLAYARFLAEGWLGEFGGVLPTACGFRWFDRDRVLTWIERIEAFWGETIDPTEDPVLAEIARELEATRPRPRWNLMSQRQPLRAVVERFPKVLRASGLSIGRSLGASLPNGALYLNVGQIGLAMKWLLGWLDHRADVKPVFMLHDVIPIERPELVSPRGHHYHHRMVDNAALYAAGLITTTQSARDSVLREVRRRGRRSLTVESLPLPVASRFLSASPQDHRLAQHDYFIICGTIEPRKNHLLLLDVWRALVKEQGRRAPKLIVVGSPGWGAEGILHELSRYRATRDHILPASGLSTPGLRSLLANAKALLMPSFAEGFGLPIIEALAVGTPVIASDLPAHREAAGPLGIFCDPTDGHGWLNEIRRLALEPDWAAECRRRVALYRPCTAGDYFARISRFLNAVHADAPARAPNGFECAGRAGRARKTPVGAGPVHARRAVVAEPQAEHPVVRRD